MNEWLKNLKAGDEVAIRRGERSCDIVFITRAEERTVSSCGYDYRREDGFCSTFTHAGDAGNRIVPATDEMRQLAEETDRRRQMKDAALNTSRLTADMWERIAAILAEPATPTPEASRD